MERLNNCITVNNKGEFEISTYKIYTTDKGFTRSDLPQNLVLEVPEKKWSNNDYTLVNNGVKVLWLDYYNSHRWKCLTVLYKNTKLLEINAVRKIQNVVDVLNRFKDISYDELDMIYQRALKEEKSELIEEVESLKEEKKKLSDHHNYFTKIESKIEELRELFNKIKE